MNTVTEEPIEKMNTVTEEHAEEHTEKMNTVTEEHTEKMNELRIDIKNVDGLEYLSTIPNETIDLILTDPPYIISKETGMNAHYNKVKENEENNLKFVKTEEEWNIYKEEKRMKIF